ncbi:SEC10/PgrA surface exclusion domain-containing protein [Lactobacillus acetotolerans]|nr:SEC10/PgrA surface exclusion domain-containing protein [Lactobacillus acetotolerans]QJD73105.1 SEC10/PgrA surface exclusion domain-containing protein [Lactobacillus acetotolerans]
MRKTKLITAILSVTLLFSGAVALEETNQPQTVQAAAKKLGSVTVKGKKKVRLYKSTGKHSKYHASPKKKYSYTAKKHLKIGKKKLLAYKIGNDSHWILSKNVKVTKKISYKSASIKMPRGYTRSALLKAYQGKPSADFVKASMKGMNDNTFSRTKTAESKNDNDTIIDPTNLTTAQSSELTSYTLRLINEARSDLNLKPWLGSRGTQKLAQDIANEYTKNGRSIKDGHYVAGIVHACKANGLNLNDNYVEDMAGFYNPKQTMTMTEMKKNVYFGLKQMLFGYVGSGEGQRNNKKYYREWEHAGDLFNTQGSLHDGDHNYFGFSISKANNIYSMHYISVPTFIVKSSKYNISFRP